MTEHPKANILLVDDRPDKLLALKTALEGVGDDVVTATSGNEALRCLLKDDFAAILLDVNMPVMDGFQTAELIRQRDRTAHTPIIFITAFGDENRQFRGYSLGAVDYILTPVVPEVLRAKIGVFVDLFRKTEEVKQQAAQRVALAEEQAARAAAEEATRRSTFLAEASNQLTISLDYEATLKTAVRLWMPYLADVCAFAVLAPGGRVSIADLAAVDTEQEALVEKLRDQPLPEGAGAVIREVITTGQGQFLRGRSEPGSHIPGLYRFAAENGGGQEAFRLLQDPHGQLGLPSELNPTSAMVLPLVGRGRTLGALILLMTSSGRTFSPTDVHLAEEMAGRAAIALDNARLHREIRQRDRRKDEFLAMLGHELRNPLGAVSNAIECLNFAGHDEPLGIEARSILERQVRHMSRLVDDLLDVSRITRGKIDLRKEPLDVPRAVAAAVDTTEAYIRSRRHQLDVSLPDGEQVVVLADPTRFEQIVVNLLNNAAKYTEPGGRITLEVTASQHEVTIRVTDTGIGIRPELLPRVFDMFTQGDRMLDRSQGGLGIGLTLVRSLVELHSGEVAAFSAGPQSGSEFLVRLPRLHVDLSDEKQRIDDITQQAQASRKILVVDDNHDLATSLAALLTKSGHEVQVAGDGFAAIKAALGSLPDVILVDIGLPGMNGFEVAERLRAEQSLRGSRLIAMSGYGQASDIRRSQAAGFYQHLVKPVRLPELQGILLHDQPQQAAVEG